MVARSKRWATVRLRNGFRPFLSAFSQLRSHRRRHRRPSSHQAKRCRDGVRNCLGVGADTPNMPRVITTRLTISPGLVERAGAMLGGLVLKLLFGQDLFTDPIDDARHELIKGADHLPSAADKDIPRAM